MILDLLSFLSLFFLNDIGITLVFLFGVLFWDRTRFTQALFLLMFTTVWTGFLKEIWRIPLPDGVSTHTYAFPSGHMHGSLVFYGWLMLSLRRQWLFYVIPLVLLMGAWGMVLRGYHTWLDIGGAIFFGSVTLSIAFALLKWKPHWGVLRAWGLLMLGLCTGVIVFMEGLRHTAWEPFYLLLGLVFGEMSCGKSLRSMPRHFKIFVFLTFVMTTVGLRWLFTTQLFPQGPAYVRDMFLFILGLSFYVSLWIFSRPNKRKNV